MTGIYTRKKLNVRIKGNASSFLIAQEKYLMVIARKNAACMKSKRNHPESDLQRLCITWFDLMYKKYPMLRMKLDNEGKRTLQMGKIAVASGLLHGAADLFFAIPNNNYHGLFIELKIKPNIQQPSQVEFQKAVESMGYKYLLIYDFESFKKEINYYLCK